MVGADRPSTPSARRERASGLPPPAKGEGGWGQLQPCCPPTESQQQNQDAHEKPSTCQGGGQGGGNCSRAAHRRSLSSRTKTRMKNPPPAKARVGWGQLQPCCPPTESQ